MGAYFDYQANTPLVSTSSYPTTSSNYGLSINMSLVKYVTHYDFQPHSLFNDRLLNGLAGMACQPP